MEESLNFNFKEPITVGEIQLSAKVIREIITNGVFVNNIIDLDCPMPIEANGDWNTLKNYNSSNTRCYNYFSLITKCYNILQYSLEYNDHQLSSIETNLCLKKAQTLFQNWTDPNLRDIDTMIMLFLQINTAISDYFYWEACNHEIFSWNAKYSPCFFDKEYVDFFKGLMCHCITKSNGVEKAKFLLCKKYLTHLYFLQLKYLTFWVSLLDMATFPGLTNNEKAVYDNLIQYLLTNYSNIYIYDLVVESSIIKNSHDTANRGSNSNTTRIKIYFTPIDNDEPELIRVDLPHVNCPYVHINSEDENGNQHIRISNDETISGEYDKIFDNLENTLQLYNFYIINCMHSRVEDDKQTFKEIRYWIVMYKYVTVVIMFLLQGDNCEICKSDYAKKIRETIVELLVEDGVAESDVDKLNPFDLFEFADELINKNKLICF